MLKRFQFLRYPLQPFPRLTRRMRYDSPTGLRKHLLRSRYSVRLLRYWWAGQALAAEAKRLGRPLCVVDLGCEKGWLKYFTPEEAVERWIGLDWNAPEEVVQLAGYDVVRHANLDQRLPVEGGVADAVVGLHIFEHLLRPGVAMAEVSRILKLGGIFLGGSPTMPHWLGKLREGYFRHRLRHGKIALGGHVSVLSPARWKALAKDAGLSVDFVTGSHAVRHTGGALENQKWWIRLNQIWGGLFPALGSECYLMARREGTDLFGMARLEEADPHRRALWISLATLSCIALTAFGVWSHVTTERELDQRVAKWLDTHQDGDQKILIWEDSLEKWDRQQPYLISAHSKTELNELTKQYSDAYLWTSVDSADSLVKMDHRGRWKVEARLDRPGPDYLLLRQRPDGVQLKKYMLAN